jgi:hypothetical protein
MKRAHRGHQPNSPILLSANFARDGTHALATVDYFHMIRLAPALFRIRHAQTA